MIGSMENVTETPGLNMDDIERIAAEKIKEIYKEKKERKTKINEAILTVLPDGKIGYYCKVSAVLREPIEGQKDLFYEMSDPYDFMIY